MQNVHKVIRFLCILAKMSVNEKEYRIQLLFFFVPYLI